MKSTLPRALSAYALLLYWLIGCAPTATVSAPAALPLPPVTAPPNASPTPTAFQPSGPMLPPSPIPPTDTPTATSTAPLLPTPNPTQTAHPPPSQVILVPSPRPRLQYLLYARLDYARKRVDVEYLAAYPNQTGQPLDTLVLAIDANLYPNGFIIKNLTCNDQTAPYRLNSNRLEVTLPAPLLPGETATLSITYTLWLPQKGAAQVYGYNNAQLNLVDWFPQFVPYQPGTGWLIYAPWPFGEHLSFDAANFDIYLQLTDPTLDVQMAASAPPQPNDEWTHYHLEAARTFALSASPYFLTATRQVNGITLTSAYFGGHEYAGQAVLDYAEQALNLYASLFGPYPHATLSMVETHLNDGMEYDGLIFLSRDFYSAYNGTARSNLAMISIHEVAHQWWYSAVGSNQAQEPWLDEALATYAECIFYERTYPADLAWWWNFRINFFAPTGYVDTTIFNGGNFRKYTNAVYLNGANFLEEVRQRIGDAAFFAFLYDYTTRMTNQRATTADFFNILSEHAQTDITDITRRYFQSPP